MGGRERAKNQQDTEKRIQAVMDRQMAVRQQ
jgi:hypothetical protein